MDVPVYCLNAEGRLEIQIMRNPRLTQKRQMVYKLTLDDGSTIRATSNHSFLLKKGEYTALKDIRPGDSLMVLTKFQAPVVNEAGKKQTDYWWLNEGAVRSNKSEHRIIAEFYQKRKIGKCEVVHHIDYNGLNNCPQNLEIMDAEAHDTLHKADKMGQKNPIFKIKSDPDKFKQYSQRMSAATSGLKNGNAFPATNEMVFEKAFELSEKLGRRFSKKEWQGFAKANSLPMTFSKFR